MKKYSAAFLLGLCALSFAGCAAVPMAEEAGSASQSGAAQSNAASSGSASPQGTGSSAAWQTVDAEAAKALMEEPGAVIVDVRTQEEYEDGHIPGAVLIPNETLQAEKERPAALPDTDALVLVYCRSGRRSAQAAERLAQLGYTRVVDFGGIIDWPYDTVTGGEVG